MIERGDPVVEAGLANADGYFTRPTSEDPNFAGIYFYTCGGQHLLQALLVAASRDWLSAADRERVGRRIDVYLARIDAEDGFRVKEYQASLRSGSSERQSSRLACMFRLKLAGHALATLARAARTGLRTEAIERAIPRVRERVYELFRVLVTELDPRGELWGKMRGDVPRQWELWFGDSCHAIDGLNVTRKWSGR